MHPKQRNYVELDPVDWLARYDERVAELPVVVRNASLELGDRALKLFEQTVETWKRKPLFRVFYEDRKDGDLVYVGTDDKIYSYVDEGTGPRDIVPRKPGGVLVFRAVYKPRTKPGSLKSGRKWVGGKLIFTKKVTGHRITPRYFTAQVYQRVQLGGRKPYKSQIERWLKEFERGAG